MEKIKIKLSKINPFKKLTGKKSDLKVKEIIIDECYEAVDRILNRFYNPKEQDEAYIEFLKEIEKESLEEEKKDNEDLEHDQELIKKYLKQKLGRTVSDDELYKLLNVDEKHKKNLSIDPYMQQIMRILNQTKVARRSSDKPMMTPKSQTLMGKASSEAHLTTRGMHEEQVGDLSAEIAEALGLNVKLARAGGKHHDDGHTNSGHTGERIATMVGRLNNCGYIVHNALSADMLIGEGVVEEVINAVEEKEGKLSPERKEEITNDMWYLFDIMISHNGEGKDRIIHYNPNKTVEDIKTDKNKCYTIPGYDRNIVSGSKEAAIIAFADKVCYVRTDLLDGVNLGILTDLNDEYLQYIGILAAKSNGRTDLIKISDKVFEKEDVLEKEIESMKKRIKKAGIELIKEDETGRPFYDIDEKTLKQLSEKAEIDPSEFADKIDKYLKIKEMSDQVLEATKNYGRAYVSKIPIERRAETVANMVKDVTTKDLIEYSNRKEYIGISPAVAKAFFGIRYQNLEQIVKFTRRRFEKELLPEAEYKIHGDLKNALLETGIIREYLERDEEEEFELADSEIRARKKYGLNEDLEIKGPQKALEEKKYISTTLKKIIPIRNKYKYERKTCHRFLKLFKYQPDRLAEIYQNALDAVDQVTAQDVELIVSGKGVEDNEILRYEYLEKLGEVELEIASRYQKGFSDKEKEAFVQELANRRKNDKENLLASAIALEYVSGMTDGTILEAAKIKSYLTNGSIRRGYKREGEVEKAVEKMGKFWNQSLNLEDLRIILDNVKTLLEDKETER